MAGKKGLSGRKKTTDESKRLRIIERSWEVIEDFLNSDAPLRDRAKIAISIAAKNVPTELLGQLSVNEMGTIEKNGIPIGYTVGQISTSGDSECPGQVAPDNNPA